MMRVMDPRANGPDRLRALIDLVADSLDEGLDGSELAQRASFSRFHFGRLLSAAIGEPPGAFRRRLLLERAAWQIGWRGMTVTDAALEAGYGSLEAFTRSFRRAFGLSPRSFRSGPAGFRLTSPNGIHFHPPAGILVPGPTGLEGRRPMDLTDRMLEHDRWLTARLLDRAVTMDE